MNVKELGLEVVKWAHDTFGYKRNLVSINRKLVEEIDELKEDVINKNYSNLEDEVADVLILLFDMCHILGIDVESAVSRKLEINKLRTWVINEETGVGRHAE